MKYRRRILNIMEAQDSEIGASTGADHKADRLESGT